LFTRHVLFSTLAVVACAVPASATISYYSDPGAFAADNVSAQSISFDASLGQTFASFSLDGFTFTTTSTFNSNLTVLPNPGGSWPTSPSTDVLAQAGSFANGSIVITLPANVFAFALDTSYTLAMDDINIVVTAGGSFPSTGLNTTSTAPFFLGVRSDQAITSITLSKPSTSPNFGEAIQLGAFMFDTVSGSDAGSTGGGDPGTAPEPATFLLIGTGLAAVPLVRRLRRS
jgi:hypothetical protein